MVTVQRPQSKIIAKDVPNKAAPGISYYTPAQIPPAGTVAAPQPNGSAVPMLFRPLKIGNVTLQNRIMVSPMCQYSAQDGHLTDWHLTHIGGIVQRGPGLTMIEATAVAPEGRITPEDSGLWKESQMEPLRRIVEFAHSQGQLIAIQLAHAGRKASTIAPWLSGDLATTAVGGWPEDTIAPSAIPFKSTYPHPREMTLHDIEEFKAAFVTAVKRSVSIGFDVVEIHAAHGYLLHEFLSPVSNHRADKYGGSFENRTRLVVELAELIRKAVPKGYPVFVRVSATDGLENIPEFKESWTVDQTVKLALILADKGIDLIDVSSGGNHPQQQIKAAPGYQVPYAAEIKRAVGDKMLVGTVGIITSGTQADEILETEDLDLAIVGRAFQQNPGLVFSWAAELGLQVQMPNQIQWGVRGRA